MLLQTWRIVVMTLKYQFFFFFNQFFKRKYVLYIKQGKMFPKASLFVGNKAKTMWHHSKCEVLIVFPTIEYILKWIKHQYYCVMATNWCHKLQVSYSSLFHDKPIKPLSLWINQTLNPLIVTKWTLHFPKYWTAIALTKVIWKRCDGCAERRFFFGLKCRQQYPPDYSNYEPKLN